jgi:hypothetical protein
MKEITNINSKGEFHGYQQWYWDGDGLIYRGNYKNYLRIGYTEWYNIYQTRYHIK